MKSAKDIAVEAREKIMHIQKKAFVAALTELEGRWSPGPISSQALLTCTGLLPQPQSQA